MKVSVRILLMTVVFQGDDSENTIPEKICTP